MRRLNQLSTGNAFRVAHPEQVSKNNRKMFPGDTFAVSKIYPMEPGYFVCRRMCGAAIDGQPYVLHPETPVILPGETPPEKSEVEQFVVGNVPRKQVVGYRVQAGGVHEAVSGNLSSSRQKLLLAIASTGVREFTKTSLDALLESIGFKISRTQSAKAIFAAAAKLYVAKGILVPTYSASPAAEADLAEVIGTYENK